ncbi:hypothetical protein E5Q_01552 [Mixia osmundae IAM 14324]|uniref:Uncharacterized protein n=1 Tax=Mixia osmundae (strain CBS 9802 / IAM 14324 / JCM 22182 / KY 12970) TaxID=764103 RepID=G7DWD7_MIXOS|nr:hypothetical protein E5Q_01552 [Mixia osmundae IAM 14324]
MVQSLLSRPQVKMAGCAVMSHFAQTAPIQIYPRSVARIVVNLPRSRRKPTWGREEDVVLQSAWLRSFTTDGTLATLDMDRPPNKSMAPYVTKPKIELKAKAKKSVRFDETVTVHSYPAPITKSVAFSSRIQVRTYQPARPRPAVISAPAIPKIVLTSPGCTERTILRAQPGPGANPVKKPAVEKVIPFKDIKFITRFSRRSAL